jgi:hypothetical protein
MGIKTATIGFRIAALRTDSRESWLPDWIVGSTAGGDVRVAG